MSYVPIPILREHLKVDDQTSDTYLEQLDAVGARAVENETGLKLTGPKPTISFDDKPVAVQAILMLAAGWLANPESFSPAAYEEVPLGVKWLLHPLKRWSV